MPELIEAGYVYIAKPPLYKVKNGKQETYIEKESELEELLLRDKLEEFELTRRRRQAAQADRAPAGSASTGASRSTRAGPTRCRPSSATRWSRFLARVADPRRGRGDASPGVQEAARGRRSRGGAVRDRARLGDRRRARGQGGPPRERARPHPPALGRRCSSRHDYRHLVEVHGELLKQVGRPPFEVTLGDKRREARLLRRAAPRGARARPPGRHAAALQGPRRDERRAAARDDDGSREPHAAAGDDRRRRDSPSGSSPS